MTDCEKKAAYKRLGRMDADDDNSADDESGDDDAEEEVEEMKEEEGCSDAVLERN